VPKLKPSNGSTSKVDDIPEEAEPESSLIAHRLCARRYWIDAVAAAARDGETLGQAVVIISEKKSVLAMSE
jgi:hypothetical protein